LLVGLLCFIPDEESGDAATIPFRERRFLQLFEAANCQGLQTWYYKLGLAWKTFCHPELVEGQKLETKSRTAIAKHYFYCFAKKI